MKSFDVLDPETPILGHHFLEASAGTGKTFAIEKITARLIAEENFALDEILIVTFTRAATRDLKTRIYQTLRERELEILLDQAQIFTIHGFCHRMLTEYAFEAGEGFALLSEEESDYRKILKEHITDFLRTSLSHSEYSTSQIATLMRRFRQDKEALVNKILSLTEKEGEYPNYLGFTDSYRRYLDTHYLAPLDLVSQFNKIYDRFGGVKEPWATQLELLDRSDLSPEEFDLLIASDKSVLSLFTEENLAKKSTLDPSPLYKLREALLPTLQQASSPLCTLVRIARACSKTTRAALEREAVLAPDDILKKMAEALELPAFKAKVQSRYRAAIIDEFQDTDSTQWHIFKSLFVDHPISSLFLVGDPKQSIYSFRNADIYTYLQAQKSVPNRAHLDTNYRSDPALVQGLNALFSEKPDWLSLPALPLPFHPVKYLDRENTSFPDSKEAVHFFVYETEKRREKSWPSPEIEKSTFFPFIASEIHALTKEQFQFSDFAILVKDRYQAARLKSYLDSQAIPTLSKSTQPLRETASYTLIRALLEAYFEPTEIPIKRFLAHPLQPYSQNDLLNEELLAETINTFRATPDLNSALRDLFKPRDLENYSDFLKLTELILENPQDPLNFLDTLTDTPRRPLSDSRAVTIMTIHMSKGLEFNIVFALGLINRYTGRDELIRHKKEWLINDPDDPECQAAIQNQEAEKMRQLYVAFTRAKKRLYIPLLIDSANREIPPGQASPLELLNPTPKSATYLKPHTLTQPVVKPPILHHPKKITKNFPPRHLHSYSSLARSTPQPPVTTQTDLPKGPQTGLLLHSLLETILRHSLPDSAIPDLIKKHLPLNFPYQPVQTLIHHALNTPLSPHTFTLRDISPHNLHPEIEFLYPTQSNYVKGFIDLVFTHNDRTFILDWKTNLLPDYSHASLLAAMDHHDYNLQAQLYTTALSRYLPRDSLAGTYYIFLRGLPTSGILFLPKY
ncbi:MAG: RecBCD enzyme subunit RecB [Chlamydiae bacterium]|nr:RecBCD enzyme subunit RecB [Chlamydiota bacterium]